MQKQCEDNFYTTFSSALMLQDYHDTQAKNSRWYRCQVNELQVEPLDSKSPLYSDITKFAAGVTQDAVTDTAENLGIAIRVDGQYYPVRMTAYKSLLDRAKIGGTALPKLSRKVLAEVLNECLHLFSSEALLLIRDEKVSAVHSGDSSDYSVLPINELLAVLTKKLDERFPGNEFESGYSDHSVSSAAWILPNQREELIGTYRYTLGFGDSSEKNHMVGEFLEKIGNKKSAIIVEAVAQYLESHPEINMDCRRIQVKIKPDISWAELEEKIRSIIDEKISVAQASGGLENTGSQPIIADADIDEMLHNLDLFD